MTDLSKQGMLPPDASRDAKAWLCIGISHFDRPQNYLLHTSRSLVEGGALADTVVTICVSPEHSANLAEVAREFGSLIGTGQLVIDRHEGNGTLLDDLVRNSGMTKSVSDGDSSKCWMRRI